MSRTSEWRRRLETHRRGKRIPLQGNSFTPIEVPYAGHAVTGWNDLEAHTLRNLLRRLGSYTAVATGGRGAIPGSQFVSFYDEVILVYDLSRYLPALSENIVGVWKEGSSLVQWGRSRLLLKSFPEWETTTWHRLGVPSFYWSLMQLKRPEFTPSYGCWCFRAIGRRFAIKYFLRRKSQRWASKWASGLVSNWLTVTRMSVFFRSCLGTCKDAAFWWNRTEVRFPQQG
jgi:hypothetical protein